MRTIVTRPRHRLLGDLTWHQDAACRPTEYHPVDPEIFYPAPDDADAIATAKAHCAQCPVHRACLDAALETKDTWGIRGGMTEQERESLHEKLDSRCDWTRVNEALSGRDVHLTKAERHAVVQAAHHDGIPADWVAHVLKVTKPHAKKLLREARRAVQHGGQDTAHLDRSGYGQAA
jgi:WhiB family redox-sensing transcriptional regulator